MSKHEPLYIRSGHRRLLLLEVLCGVQSSRIANCDPQPYTLQLPLQEWDHKILQGDVLSKAGFTPSHPSAGLAESAVDERVQGHGGDVVIMYG